MSRRNLLAFALIAAAALMIALFAPRARTTASDGATAQNAANRPSDAVYGVAPSSKRPPLRFPEAARPAAGHVLARASWGSGPAELGHRLDPESAPEGPMSLTTDSRGDVWVLDQLNHRVQRWTSGGKRLAPIPIGGDTAQDLLAARDGRLLLLDRLGEQNVQLLDGAGKPLGDVALRGPKLPEPGGVTGLYTDDSGAAFAEREHGELVGVADADGRPLADRPTLPGRPRRDGRAFLRGAIVDRAAGTFAVRALDASGAPLWDATLAFGAPVLYIVLLDSDASGAAYAGARTGRESAQPPYAIVDERIELRSLDASGSARGALSLDATPAPEEIFREFTVADDGTLYRMRRTPDGILIESFHL
jgi:hypothetical protein